MADIIHGSKIKIFPSDDQRKRLDLWRRRCISLWNLLLGMEIAAYDGNKYKPGLGWRRIWAEVVRADYENAVRTWNHGKLRRDGSVKKAAGAGKEPIEPTAEFYAKIAGGSSKGAPAIFLWDNDLLKVMARLKQVPLSGWIADLHSHAAQAVCADLTDAIRKMIRDRAKGEDTGFPRFKKQGYAAGSVYFANTQVKIDWAKQVIALSNGIGGVPCGDFGKIPAGAKLCEARAWREGEQWWISAVFRFAAPEPLPATGRECGVKIAAAAIYTIYDGDHFTQVQAPKITARQEALLAAKSKRAQRRKAKSGHWYEAQNQLVKEHAKRRNRRSDAIHKGSRAIVNAFDVIAIDKMKVKPMLKKDGSKGKRNVRKLIANAAMYDAAQKVKYKVEEAGRIRKETPVLFPSTQLCAICGKIHHEMKSGKRKLVCECGNRLQRQENAAINIASQS